MSGSERPGSRWGDVDQAHDVDVGARTQDSRPVVAHAPAADEHGSERGHDRDSVGAATTTACCGGVLSNLANIVYLYAGNTSEVSGVQTHQDGIARCSGHADGDVGCAPPRRTELPEYLG